MGALELDARSAPSRFARGELLVGRFLLQRKLAAGGSGEVWLATNQRTQGLVAIKLVSDGAAHVAERFRQEAALSSRLAHRNIVRVFDFIEMDHHRGLGLVMECLRGETARERLERAGALSPRGAVALATQALAGLAHAHEKGIVHRDIKPPNLFLATDPDACTTTKLLDFGIAQTPSKIVHTLQGQILGTPRYMSPEQIRTDATIDGRSDLFSLAVVLYELMTGRSPFDAPFATASLAAVLEAEVERDERIPPPLWHVLSRALAKNPDQRPATASAFAAALRASVGSSDGVLAKELHRSRPPPPMLSDDSNVHVIPSSQQRDTPSPRARRAAWIVAGAVVSSVALLAVGVVGAARRKAEPMAVVAPMEATAAAPLPTEGSAEPAPTPSSMAPIEPAAHAAPAEPTARARPQVPPPRAAPPTFAAPSRPKLDRIARDPGF